MPQCLIVFDCTQDKENLRPKRTGRSARALQEARAECWQGHVMPCGVRWKLPDLSKGSTCAQFRHGPSQTISTWELQQLKDGWIVKTALTKTPKTALDFAHELPLSYKQGSAIPIGTKLSGLRAILTKFVPTISSC